MSLYDVLREKYPTPVRGTGQVAPPDSYCVGGALALELGHESYLYPASAMPGSAEESEPGRGAYVEPSPQEATRMLAAIDDRSALLVGAFPGSRALAVVLCEANPALPVRTALEFAKHIVRKNDTGNFETAWQTLADALAWSPGGWTPADDDAVATFVQEHIPA